MSQQTWRHMEGPYSTEEEGYYDNTLKQDCDIQDITAQCPGDEPKKKKPWERLGPDGRPIKRKPNPARKNAMFRKALQPKNAVMCLNELQTGLKYVSEPMAHIGNYCVAVEVNGQTFRGYGSSKDLAKQAAAEAALISFVKPPTAKPVAGETNKSDDDTTPWRTLASFAMYKLFTDWRDGRFGITGSTGQQPSMMASLQGYHQMMPPVTDQSMESVTNVSAYLTRNAAAAQAAAVEKIEADGNPKPALLKPMNEKKQNLDVLRTRHPVMVLHQLCPGVTYNTAENVESGTHTKTYTVTATIGNQEFTEQASAIKKAKFNLAKTALRLVYNIESAYGEQ